MLAMDGGQRLQTMLPSFRATVPQLWANVDRAKVKKQGVDVTDVFATLQTYLGSLYINDFNRDGRTYQRFRASSAHPVSPSKLTLRPSLSVAEPAHLPKTCTVVPAATTACVEAVRTCAGVMVASIQLPRRRHGFSGEESEYSHSASGRGPSSTPSTTSAFSVEPVPSVHLAPRVRPTRCPAGLMPEPAAQFHSAL